MSFAKSKDGTGSNDFKLSRPEKRPAVPPQRLCLPYRKITPIQDIIERETGVAQV
jgi:hypothetical protein